MKPGEGQGYCLADIAEGLDANEVRKRWQQGHYGKSHERPSAARMAELFEHGGLR